MDVRSRGIMEASALYEPSFSSIHSGGPEQLFSGRENVINGIFEKLEVAGAGLIGQVG